MRSEGDFGCDLVEMELHGFAVASRQHEGSASSTFGTDRTKQISRLRHEGVNPSWPSDR